MEFVSDFRNRAGVMVKKECGSPLDLDKARSMGIQLEMGSVQLIELRTMRTTEASSDPQSRLPGRPQEEIRGAQHEPSTAKESHVAYAITYVEDLLLSHPQPTATAPLRLKGKPGPNRIDEHRKLAEHARAVFGKDLPDLPPIYYLRLAERLDSDDCITPPLNFDSFDAYLTPKLEGVKTRRGQIRARKSREREFRRLIINRLKRLPEFEALFGVRRDS
jgi:hypothetical protein